MSRTRCLRPSPAVLIALLALVLSVAGPALARDASGFAARVISGRTIKQHSISGIRLKNNTLTGLQINEAKLGPVPTAANAVTAQSATSALNAVNAASAGTAATAGSATTAARADELAGHARFFTRAAATSGVSLAAALAASPEVALAELGTVSLYARCLRDASGGPQVEALVYVRTTIPGGVLDAPASQLLGSATGDTLGPATSQDRRVIRSVDTVGADTATFAGAGGSLRRRRRGRSGVQRPGRRRRPGGEPRRRVDGIRRRERLPLQRHARAHRRLIRATAEPAPTALPSRDAALHSGGVSFLLAFLGFAALILLHEFGHFAAAKAVGMRVERFSLFFPPHVWKRQRGETEYAIGVIPLGGYVRITGMTANEEIPEEVAYRAYHRMPVWKRIVVIAAGPGMNFLIAFVILYALYGFAGTNSPTDRVHRLEAGKPAAAVLRPGDQLVAVDGHRGDVAGAARSRSQRTAARARQIDGCAALTPGDGDRAPRRDAADVPRSRRATTPPPGRARLGFDFATDHRATARPRRPARACSEMWRVSTVTVSAIAKIFYSEKARKDVSGVVGSYETTRQAISFDWLYALNILAIISLSLALVNLFPFLPLDGGHIFWALAEKVRGRAIPFAVMERASVVGFVLIICLFAIGLTNDIGRLQGQGFGIR